MQGFTQSDVGSVSFGCRRVFDQIVFEIVQIRRQFLGQIHFESSVTHQSTTAPTASPAPTPITVPIGPPSQPDAAPTAPPLAMLEPPTVAASTPAATASDPMTSIT